MNEHGPRRTATGRALESWYRRLLWAYPPAYRTGHGSEIVGTLLESRDLRCALGGALFLLVDLTPISP